MGLKNMSINTGGTVSNSGGTALVFADDGVSVPNGVHVSAPAVADFRVRPHATFRYAPPSLQSDGSYTRQSNRATLVVPKALASLKYVNNAIRIELDVHPESTATEVADLRKLGAQMLIDSDTDNFWTAGSTS